jgi:hypothetical protein
MGRYLQVTVWQGVNIQSLQKNLTQLDWRDLIKNGQKIKIEISKKM